MGFSDPVDLPEHGESRLVSVGIFEILRLDLVAQCQGTCRCPRPPGTIKTGWDSFWMDGFPVFLSWWIPYEFDRLLDGSGFEYL